MLMTRGAALLPMVAGGLMLALLSGCSGGNPHLSTAEDAVSQQRYDEALARIDSALAEDPSNAEAYLLKATILRKKADSTMAPSAYKELYRQARAAEETAVRKRASVQDKVEPQRQQAFRQQSRKGTQAFREGQSTSDSASFRRAAAHFGAAAATYPDSAGVILNEAYSYLNYAENRQEGTMTDAIPVLERYIETADAPEANAYNILGALYLQNEQPEKAIDLLETAKEDLAARPTHLRFEGSRGLEYEGTIEVEGSSRSVEGTTPDRVRLDTEEGTVSGTFTKKQSQGKLRVRLFYQGTEVQSTTVSSGEARISANLNDEDPLKKIEDRLLNAQTQAGNTEEAMRARKKKVERNPDDATARYNYGSMLLQADRFDEAIEQLRKAVELESGNVKAQYNLGAAYSNKARQVQDRIAAIDDSLKTISEQAVQENREPTAEEKRKVNALDEKKKELKEKKKSLFKKAVPPLKRAHQMSDADESFHQDACRALVTAYVQIEKRKKAKEYEECAGLQVEGR